MSKNSGSNLEKKKTNSSIRGFDALAQNLDIASTPCHAENMRMWTYIEEGGLSGALRSLSNRIVRIFVAFRHEHT